MKNLKIGRPRLETYINNELLKSEIEKYLKGQKAVTTYRNIGIGKTSFFRILKEMEVKR